MSFFAEVIQSWGGSDATRFLTLYVAGTPAGSSKSRADYWSLSIEDAEKLGTDLLEAAGYAKVKARGRSVTTPRSSLIESLPPDRGREQ